MWCDEPAEAAGDRREVQFFLANERATWSWYRFTSPAEFGRLHPRAPSCAGRETSLRVLSGLESRSNAEDGGEFGLGEALL